MSASISSNQCDGCKAGIHVIRPMLAKHFPGEAYEVRWDSIAACYRSVPQSNPYRAFPTLGDGTCVHRHKRSDTAADCALRRERKSGSKTPKPGAEVADKFWWNPHTGLLEKRTIFPPEEHPGHLSGGQVITARIMGIDP